MKSIYIVRMKTFIQKRLAFISFIFIILVLLSVDYKLKFWNQEGRVIAHDVKSYYAYLPAFIIHHNIGLDSVLSKSMELNEKYGALPSPAGKYVMQYTMGNALMYSPFFIFAHISSPLFGFAQDGYSAPYKIGLLLSSIFYLIIGMFLLIRYLSVFYKQYAIAFSILIIFLGTNLLYYSTLEAAMPHSYSFALICVFIYLTYKWYLNPNALLSIMLGLVIGLIVLIRPSNIIVLIFFLLYGIDSLELLKRRILLLMGKSHYLLLMAIFSLIVWIPQLLYWKHVTGHYLYYSYGSQGFYFNNPQVLNSLFSYKKGWILYTPLMSLSFIGLFIISRYQKGLTFAIVLFLILNIYILSSWCQWWFGGSFGLRAYIDSYAILALPLTALNNYILSRRLFKGILYILLIVGLIILNLFQTSQYYHGSIHWVNMNREAYWDSFGRLKPSSNFKNLINQNYSNIKDNTLQDKDQYILNQINKMKADTSWYREIKEKAFSRGISVDSMMYFDANWLYEKAYQNGKGPTD